MIELHKSNLILDDKKYSLIVTKSLEDKIRYLCAKFPDNEYSGALFYRVEGDFSTNDLKIVCVDFCICDIGSSTYTEFETRPEVVSYMCNNDLIDCYIGLLHSHNRMKTFLSSTDMDTLEAEGKTMPHFVSLIVNNSGEYSAAITSKIVRVFVGTVTENSPSFNNSLSVREPVNKEFSDVRIKYNNLDITVERDSWYDYITDRIQSIQEAKTVKSPVLAKQLSIFDDNNVLDLVVDRDTCEKVIKKTLYLDSTKDVSKNTVMDSILNCIKKNDIDDDLLYNKIEKVMMSAIKKEVATGKSLKTICDDITVYVNDFNYDKTLKLADDIENVLLMLFDVATEILDTRSYYDE